MRKIEKGEVLNLRENGIEVDADYTVWRDSIPVGSVKANLTWFVESPIPKPEDIYELVYLDYYKWGLKQLSPIVDEFDKLFFTDKEKILIRYLDLEPC